MTIKGTDSFYGYQHILLSMSPVYSEQMYIIHEEPEFVVVVKSSGLLSVPGRGPENLDCVSERVKARYPGCIEQPAVHRLDMDTSGLLVVARTREAHRKHLSSVSGV